MKIIDLVQLLEGYDPDTEVRLMSQANWPFEYDITGIWTNAPAPDACNECGLTKKQHPTADPYDFDAHDYEEYDTFTPHGNEDRGYTEIVYIVEGTQLGYGDKAAWEEVERPY
jgi:hypothetical protein